MEEERERAVQAYRSLKKQKQQQHEARNAMNANLEKLKNLSWHFLSKKIYISSETETDWKKHTNRLNVLCDCGAG